MNTNEILNFAKDVVDNVEFKPQMRSISSQASKSIYYFPDAVSQDVLPETASLIAANVESMNAMFIKACFAMTPAMVIKGKDTVNVEDYLNKFHQNIGIKGDQWRLSLKEDVSEWKMFPNGVLNEASLTLSVDDVKHMPKFDSIKEIENKNKFRPTFIEVKVTFIIDGKDVEVNIPVGVKTYIHSVNTNDMRKQIIDILNNKGIFNNLIRYNSGEIMSLKNILFDSDRMKKNIVGSSKNELSRYMNMIDRRKRLNKLSIAFLGKKPFLPNMTMHISMNDVNEIYRQTGINLLTNISRTIKFVEDNFLLSLVITDDNAKTAYILYDSHTAYEEYPYKSLKRDNDKTSDTVDSLIKGLGIGMSM